MYVARNNIKTPIIYTSDPQGEIQKLRQEFKFYQKALKVLYGKKMLKNCILERMQDIANTRIFTYPDVGSAIKPATNPKGGNAFRCLKCNKISIFPARNADGNVCKECRGHLTYIGEVAQRG